MGKSSGRFDADKIDIASKKSNNQKKKKKRRGKHTGWNVDILDLPLSDLADTSTSTARLARRNDGSRSTTRVALRLHGESTALNLESPHAASPTHRARRPLGAGLHARASTGLATGDDVDLDALLDARARLEEVERDGRFDIVTLHVAPSLPTESTSTKEVLKQIRSTSSTEPTAKARETGKTSCTKAGTKGRTTATSSAKVGILSGRAVGVVVGSLLVIREGLQFEAYGTEGTE